MTTPSFFIHFAGPQAHGTRESRATLGHAERIAGADNFRPPPMDNRFEELDVNESSFLPFDAFGASSRLTVCSL
jgi:hypothetical protein